MARNRHAKKSTIMDVAITTAGRFDVLRKCLKSLEEQQNAPKFDVYLIDNDSKAEDRLANKDIFENPILQETKRLTSEVGFPALANEVARMGNSPLIMILSDDVTLKPDVIQKVVKRMDDPEIGAMGIKLLYPEDSVLPGRPAGKVQHIGHAMDINGNVVHPLMGWSPDNPKCCISREVCSVTGACYVIRRNVFSKVGGFDLDFGLGTFEDVSLSFAVRRLGKKVFIDTDAVGYHYTGATVEKKQRGFPLAINNMIFKAKWAQSGLMVWDNWKFY